MSANRIILCIAVAEFAAFGLFLGLRKAMATSPTGTGGTLGVTYDEGCSVVSANVNGSLVNPQVAVQLSAGTAKVNPNGSVIVSRGAWVNLEIQCASHAHML